MTKTACGQCDCEHAGRYRSPRIAPTRPILDAHRFPSTVSCHGTRDDEFPFESPSRPRLRRPMCCRQKFSWHGNYRDTRISQIWMRSSKTSRARPMTMVATCSKHPSASVRDGCWPCFRLPCDSQGYCQDRDHYESLSTGVVLESGTVINPSWQIQLARCTFS